MYFEDVKCTKVITDLNSWKTIPALGHDFENGKCIVCSVADPDYEPTNAGDETDGPKTGYRNSIVMWIAVLFVSGGVLGTLTFKRKKKER